MRSLSGRKSSAAISTPAKIARPPSSGVASRARPRSLISSTAPTRRARRATTGVSSAATANATRKRVERVALHPSAQRIAGRPARRRPATDGDPGRAIAACGQRPPDRRRRRGDAADRLQPTTRLARAYLARLRRPRRPRSSARAARARAPIAPSCSPSGAPPRGLAPSAAAAARAGGDLGAGRHAAACAALGGDATATRPGARGGDARVTTTRAATATRPDGSRRAAAAVGARAPVAADVGARRGRRDRARPHRAARGSAAARRYEVLPRLGRPPARACWSRSSCGPTRRATPARCASSRREAEALARLAHPVLVRGFDAVLDGRFPHLLIEHLEGPTLRDADRPRRRRCRSSSSLPLALHVARRAALPGRRGRVHLDVKPRQHRDGRAAAADRPQRRAHRRARAAGCGGRSAPTRYMAPEQCDAAARGRARPAGRRLRARRDAAPRGRGPPAVPAAERDARESRRPGGALPAARARRPSRSRRRVAAIGARPTRSLRRARAAAPPRPPGRGRAGAARSSPSLAALPRRMVRLGAPLAPSRPRTPRCAYSG